MQEMEVDIMITGEVVHFIILVAIIYVTLIEE